MGNSTFQNIEQKYGQGGIDYVAFRYHERRNYTKIMNVINQLKQHAKLQQNEALQFISQEQRLLQQQFTKAKTQAQAQNPDSIKMTEIRFKQSVENFSGYSLQRKKLQDLHQEVNIKYQTEKVKMEKRIRKEIMKQQNKSNLIGIKEFDDKSDKQRAKIENQCINSHPQKANQDHIQGFESKYTWETEKHSFDEIFDKEKIRRECKQGRQKIRGSIVPSSVPLCC